MINSRAKGKRGELEIVHILKAAGWPNAHRTSDGRNQATRGDIAGGPEGVHVECKLVKALNISNALDQAISDANPLDIPVVVHRPARHEWIASLPLDDLLVLLAAREKR
jgi:hypothetical protein